MSYWCSAQLCHVCTGTKLCRVHGCYTSSCAASLRDGLAVAAGTAICHSARNGVVITEPQVQVCLKAFSHGQSTIGSETPVVRLKIESRVPRVHGGVRITDIRRICTDQPLCATSLGCQPRVSQRWYDPVLQLEAAKGNSQVLEVLYAPPCVAHTGTVTGRYYCTQ